MQSLNLRVISDFNTGTARSWPGRVAVGGGGGGGGGGVTDLEAAATRRQCLSYRYNGKNFKIAACSAERSGGGGGGGGGGVESQSSFLARSQSYALLKQQMEVAAKSEDYKEAARIRDSLRLFEEEEPVLRLRRLITNAVAEEKFEEAARYRDELKEIAPHSLLQCSSDATTLTLILLDCEQLESLPRGMGTMKNLRHLYLTLQFEFLSFQGSECFTSLKTLWLVKCPQLKHLSFATQHFKSLRVLRIVECPKLVYFPSNMEHLTSLEKLWIVDCTELTLSEDDECLTGLKNLQSLYLRKLPKFTGFPLGLQEAASSLQYLGIADCISLKILPEWLQVFRFLLKLHIEDCKNLLSLPKAMKFLTALKVLNIRNSPHLSGTCKKTGTDWPGIAHINSICIRSDIANRGARVLSPMHYAISGTRSTALPKFPSQ